jgi:hypothetical protein
VRAHFLENGKRRPQLDSSLAAYVARTLAASGVLYPASTGHVKAVLEITMDDRYNAGAARGGGLLSGITFGRSWHTARDDYNIAITYRGGNGVRRTGYYRHAIVTLSGRGPPQGRGRPLKPEEAVAVVINQTVMNFLGDMQAVKDNAAPVLFVTPTSVKK